MLVDVAMSADQLLQVLRTTACRMDGVAIPKQWLANVGRGNAHHSGGVMWLRHLGVVEKEADQTRGGLLRLGIGGRVSSPSSRSAWQNVFCV